ncbi:MAG TPA: extracellular solute-binding protein [Candidatus Paceibacterota bacterium]|nr:extracellular solute-binding protein [Candidatus Paceibacterota bacterium]
MKISLFQGIIMGVFAVGALIGIFVFATFDSNSGSVGASIGTVTIWGVVPRADVSNALKEITATDKSLEHVSYVQHDIATFKNDLAAAIATGSGPDLLLISQEQLFSLRNFIQTIPDATLPARTFQSSFVGEAQLFRTTTEVYGVPVLVDPLVMYYNRSTLTSNGIATPPSTWEAITGLIPKITTKTPAGRITRALTALGSYDNVYDARGILSALFLQTGVSMSVPSVNNTRRAALAGTAGEAVLRFYTQFADPTKVSYTWDASLSSSRQTFLIGDLALYFGYASEAAFIRAASPNLDFDVAPLPQPATATNKSTYGLVYALVRARGTDNPTGALNAALYLAGSSGQPSLSSNTGLAPTSLVTINAGTSDPTLAIAYRSALYAKGWLSPDPNDTDRVFSAMIQGVTSGGLDLRAALASAERSLNALFQ